MARLLWCGSNESSPSVTTVPPPLAPAARLDRLRIEALPGLAGGRWLVRVVLMRDDRRITNEISVHGALGLRCRFLLLATSPRDDVSVPAVQALLQDVL